MPEETRTDQDLNETGAAVSSGPESADESGESEAASSDADIFGSDLDLPQEESEEQDEGPHAYDFNRPYSISRVCEKNLESICEGFVKAAGLGFTNQFRANTSIEYQGLELSSYRDFYADLPNPTCICTATMAPLKGLSLLNLDMGLVFTLMKKLLGGPIEPEVELRKFTDIEFGLARGILSRMLDHFRTGAARVVELEPQIGNLENNPVYLNAMAAGETVLLLNFSLTIEDITGAFSFCIPLAAFDPVKDLFDPEETPELRSAAEVARDRSLVLDLIQGTGGELVVELGAVDMPMQKLTDLKTGDLIPLDKSLHSPLRVLVQGKPVFRGFPGKLNKQRAVKITERLFEED